MIWFDHLPDKPVVNEDDVWQAIADSLDVDFNEIADGDLAEYL